MSLRSIALLAPVLLSACDEGGRIDGRDGDISNADMFEDIDVYCDGDVSVWDYLVVMEAYTTSDVTDVTVELFQRGDSFGPFTMDEVRPGEWYAEAWEDDIWIECESNISATFIAINVSDEVEVVDL